VGGGVGSVWGSGGGVGHSVEGLQGRTDYCTGSGAGGARERAEGWTPPGRGLLC
jgi:hypothetical protein